MNTDLHSMLTPELQTLVAERDVLDAQIASLTVVRDNIAYGVIKDCSHPFITVSNKEGSFPRDSDYMAVCLGCGLAVSGQRGMAPSAPMLDFSKSLIVFDQTSPKSCRDHIQYRLSEVQQYAMQYPKRFTPIYLIELFKDSPFDGQDLIDTDSGQYCIQFSIASVGDFNEHVRA